MKELAKETVQNHPKSGVREANPRGWAEDKAQCGGVCLESQHWEVKASQDIP